MKTIVFGILFLFILDGKFTFASQLKWLNSNQTIVGSLTRPIVSVKFDFTNTGDAPIKVVSITPSCGCTVVTHAISVVAAKEKGSIDLELNTEGYSGSVTKDILVQLDGEEKPQSLRFTVQVPIAITLRPRVLSWLVDGDINPKTTYVTLDSELRGAQISIQKESDDIICELKKIDALHYVINVHPKNIKDRTVRAFIVRAQLNKIDKAISAYAIVRKSSDDIVNIY